MELKFGTGYTRLVETTREPATWVGPQPVVPVPVPSHRDYVHPLVQPQPFPATLDSSTAAFPDLDLAADYAPPPPLPLLPQTMFDEFYGMGMGMGMDPTLPLPWDIPPQQEYDMDAGGMDVNAAWNEFMQGMGVEQDMYPQSVPPTYGQVPMGMYEQQPQGYTR